MNHGHMLKRDCWLWDSTWCLLLFLSHFAFSFSRGLRCRLQGPPSPQTHPRYGPAHRLPRRLSTPLTNQSWWPWHPCPFLPHRLHSTTSHRSNGLNWVLKLHFKSSVSISVPALLRQLLFFKAQFLKQKQMKKKIKHKFNFKLINFTFASAV